LIRTKDGFNFFKSKMKPSGAWWKRKKDWKRKCGNSLILKFKLRYQNGPKSRKKFRLSSKTMTWAVKNVGLNSLKKL
jgi:hypothetical protein